MPIAAHPESSPTQTTRSAAQAPQVRRITTKDLNWALAAGWQDFMAKRGDLIFAGVLYSVICIAAAVLALNAPLLPLFFPAVAGLSIAGPAVASGFYELARLREEGGDPSWWHFLDPLNGRSRTPLLTLSIGLGLLFFAWLAVAYAIYLAAFGGATPLTVSNFAGRLFGTGEGWMLIILGNLAGALFAVVTLVFTVVSFPMVVDKPVNADVAVSTSLAAARRNPWEVAGWGVRVAGLLLLGLLPLGLGLAVVLPWLGYSTWHLYTRIVER